MDVSSLKVEQKVIETRNRIQVRYLKDYLFSKNEILIIENNPTIASNLQKYLTRLGFERIYLCEDVNEGIELFSELIKLDKLVPVIIDDSVPDKSVRDTIREILDLNPETNIIIQTTLDSKESTIRELFDLGVFYLLKKPTRFSNVKEIIEILKKEQNHVEDTSANMEDKINSLLKINQRISLKRISEFCQENNKDIKDHLRDLEERGKIFALGSVKEIACNQCNSVRITQKASCPQCNSINFIHQDLVEHYRCGEVYPQNLGTDKCPKCNKDIGRLGNDYRLLDNFYLCEDCGDRFPEPHFELECRNCENEFKKNQANWEQSMNYRTFLS